MKINVTLYGIFESFNIGNQLEVECPSPVTLREFKGYFSKKLEQLSNKKCDMNLLQESAFATDDEIIRDEHYLVETENLSILPPICGG